MIYSGSYPLTKCQESCLAEEASKYCSHNDKDLSYYLPRHLQKPVREMHENLDCLRSMDDRMDRTGYKSCGCNLPCNEVRFPCTISYSKWPSTESTLESIITDDYIRRNFAKISAFYGDIYLTQKSKKFRHIRLVDH